MDLMVLGGNGLLGSNVMVTALERGRDVAGTYHTSPPEIEVPTEQVDIRETERVREVIAEHSPTAVINCAAMTDVDGCENDPEQAFAVNGTAPGQIAALCEDRGIDFVHTSTDYVFDSTRETPYPESAESTPIQQYGESKLDGERAVTDAHQSPLIVRLSFVYGVHAGSGELTGFPAWVRDQLRDGQETPLFTDQHMTPSRAAQAAETTLDLLDNGGSGVYHVAARSCVTPFTFGRAIANRIGADDTLLVEGRRTDLDRPADRPAYTCLSVEKVEDRLGRPQPTLSEGLRAIESHLFPGE